MKYLFLCITIFIVATKSAFGQTFSLIEILKLKTFSYSDFEIYVNNKGYQFVSADEDDYGTKYRFAVNDNNGLSERFIRYYTIKHNKSTSVSYQTSYISDYKSLRDSAIKSGFLYVKSGIYESAVYSVYKKGNMELSFFSDRGKNAYGKEIPAYEITLK